MPQFVVSLKSLKTGFINIPLHLSNTLWDQMNPVEGGIFMRVAWNHEGSSKRAYFAWNGQCSTDNSIEIDNKMAKNVGLAAMQLVEIELMKNLPLAKNVTVEPQTVDDWEMLELNVGIVEAEFLNQYRVVQSFQKITLWFNNISINLIVKETNPSSNTCVRLDNTSEIYVAPKVRKQNIIERPVAESVFVAKVYPTELTTVKLKSNEIALSVEAGIPDGTIVYCRNIDYRQMVIFKQGKEYPRQDPVIGSFLIVSNHSLNQYAIINKNIFSSLQLKCFSRLLISSVAAPKSNRLPRIIVRTQKVDLPVVSILENVRALLKSEGDNDLLIIIYSGKRIEITYNKMPINVFIFIEKDNTSSSKDVLEIPPFFIIDQSRVDSLELSHQYSSSESSLNSDIESNQNNSMPGYDNEIKECSNFLNTLPLLFKLKLGLPNFGGALIIGGAGSGKSTFLECVSRKFARNNGIFIIKVDCGKIKSEPVELVKSQLQRYMNEAIWQQPSLLAFDDIDLLLPVEGESKSSRSKRLAHFFVELYNSIRNDNEIYLMATATDKGAVHNLVIQSHIFGFYQYLKAPTKIQRVEILKGLMHHNSISVNLEDISGQMDGYFANDIAHFFNVVKQEMVMRVLKDCGTELCLQENDFTNAFKKFKPFALLSANSMESTVDWNSIGGMTATKNLLLTTMKWPTLYPQIYKNSPLRLQTGILLYGYPGCGKTMLASALANECGLNFISVKGPELLNKYIGQSEKSVRDLFNRARAASPCCLFFDEFDSIAPKRGHDNSGVTDRVVNQLLTEMDGAEGLQGVFVLAATSRPDMIDAALLRPGRLDKSILCDLPSLEDRIDILEKISKQIPFDPSVPCHFIAEQTKGFTGADLQGLINTAQIVAINEKMKTMTISVEDKPQKNIDAIIVQGNIDLESVQQDLQLLVEDKEPLSLCETPLILIQRKHIDSALKDSKPSLSQSEYAKFLRIFSEFAGDHIPIKKIGSKATYA